MGCTVCHCKLYGCCPWWRQYRQFFTIPKPHRDGVTIAKFSESLKFHSKIDSKSIKNQSKIDQQSIKNLSEIDQKSIENRSKIDQKSIQNRSKTRPERPKSDFWVPGCPEGVPEVSSGDERSFESVPLGPFFDPGTPLLNWCAKMRSQKGAQKGSKTWKSWFLGAPAEGPRKASKNRWKWGRFGKGK